MKRREYKIKFEDNLLNEGEIVQSYKVNRTEVIFSRFESNGVHSMRLSFVKNGSGRVPQDIIDYALSYFGFDMRVTAKYDEMWPHPENGSIVDTVNFEQILKHG